MKWILDLITKHTKDGTINMEAFTTELNAEAPNYVIPKDKYNEVSEENKTLKSTVGERDKQIDALKSAGSVEDLKNQVDQLQADNKAKDDKYQADLKDLRLTNAIKFAVMNDVHDADMTVNLIDKSKIILQDDGKLTGLDEQLEPLKTSKAFLFKKAEEDKKPKVEEKPAVAKVGFTVKQNNPTGEDTKPRTPSIADAIKTHLEANNKTEE